MLLPVVIDERQHDRFVVTRDGREDPRHRSPQGEKLARRLRFRAQVVADSLPNAAFGCHRCSYRSLMTDDGNCTRCRGMMAAGSLPASSVSSCSCDLAYWTMSRIASVAKAR